MMRDARIAIHAALTGVLAGVGALLYLPGNTLDGNPGYAILGSVADENAWMVAFFVSAGIGCLGFIRATTRWPAWPWRVTRFISSSVVSTMHGATAMLLLYGENAPFGAVGFLGIAFLGYYLTIRYARDSV